MAGHRAARASPAYGRHHLACSGTHGHVRIDVGNVDRDPQVHARPLWPARGRDRAGDGIHADRLHRSRFRQGPPRGIPSRRRVQPLLRHRRAGDLAAPGAGALPAGEGGRHRGRLLREGRRPREPGRRHDGARQGRAHARREDPGRCTSSRRAAEERACHRCAHAVRRHPDRLRRQLRRSVGTRAGCDVGRGDLEPGGRALLPDHRSDQGPAAEHAGTRGPVRVRLLPAGRRRPDGRPVRAGVRAVENRWRTHGYALPRPRTRLGTHGSLPRDRHVARPGHEPGRHEEVLLRSGEFHTRPEADRRRGAGIARLLRRGGTQFHRHPDGRRPRPRDGALDHQWPARRRRHRHEHRPRAAVPGQPGLPAFTHGRIARHGLQVPLPHAHAEDRARRTAFAVPRPAGGAGRVLHRDQRLGIARLVCRRGQGRGSRSGHVGPAGLVEPVGTRAPRSARERDRHGHVLHGQIHGAGSRRRPLPEPDFSEQRRRRGRRDHLHAMAQRAGQARSRPDRHQAGG